MQPMIDRYDYLDWLGMALGLLALWLLGNRDRRGFVAFMISNAIWIAIGFRIASLAMILGNAVILVVNFRGWRRWTASARDG
jgi:nicotinamide riboside transporter PnuC